MNTPEATILMQIVVGGFAWFIMMWLASYAIKLISKCLKSVSGGKLEKHTWLVTCAVKLKNASMMILGLYLFCFYFAEGQKEYDKFIASYKSPRQQRLEFLEANCKQVDIEYEILNKGNLIYKCPNGKEYKV